MRWLLAKAMHGGIKVRKSRTMTLFVPRRPKLARKPDYVPKFLESPRAQA